MDLAICLILDLGGVLDVVICLGWVVFSGLCV